MHEHARWMPMEGPKKGPFIIEPEDYPYGVFLSRANREDVVRDVAGKVMTQGYVHHRVRLGESLVVRDDPDPDGEHLGWNGGFTSPIVRVIRQDDSENVYLHTKNNSLYQVSPRHERDGNRVRITPFEKTMRKVRTACLALLGVAAVATGVTYVGVRAARDARDAQNEQRWISEHERINKEREENTAAFEAAALEHGYSGAEFERAFARFKRVGEELDRRQEEAVRNSRHLREAYSKDKKPDTPQ